MKNLKERFSDWVIWDKAEYELGVVLGLWVEFDAPGDLWHGAKGIIWSANPLGDTLGEFLIQLVKIGILERSEEPNIQYRWSENVKTPLPKGRSFLL
jgi:hypothetical protein